MNDKVIVFDMDGVLIDSEPAYMEMNKKLFGELGIKMNEANYHELVGMSSFNMWTMLKEDFNLSREVNELVKLEKNRMYEILNSDIIAGPIKGITDLLESLKGKNFNISVASSSPKDNINLVVSKLKLDKYFDYIVSGEDVEKGKPAPDIFLNAAKQFNAAPEKCFVIEDSVNGMKAALNAGMKCIGFKNNDTNFQNLSKADLLIQNFSKESITQIIAFIEAN